MIYIITYKTSAEQTYIYLVKANNIDEACKLIGIEKEAIDYTTIPEYALTALPCYDTVVIRKEV